MSEEQSKYIQDMLPVDIPGSATRAQADIAANAEPFAAAGRQVGLRGTRAGNTSSAQHDLGGAYPEDNYHPEDVSSAAEVSRIGAQVARNMLMNRKAGPYVPKDEEGNIVPQPAMRPARPDNVVPITSAKRRAS